MTCAECGHRAADHVDRIFGFRCAPPHPTVKLSASRCDCIGYRAADVLEDALAGLRSDAAGIGAWVRREFWKAGYVKLVEGDAA